jgi:hypothetical protein
MNNLNYDNIVKYDYINNTANELELNTEDYLLNPIKLIKWFLTKNSSEIIFDAIKSIDNKNKIKIITKITNLIYISVPLTLKTSIVREFINNTLINILDINLNNMNNREISDYIYSKLLRKPNIHIFTADNRELDYIKLSTEHNLNIAKKNNFIYTYINDFDYKEYPPYWMKAFKIRELMNDINNDYIMWIDSDAILTTNAHEIYNIIDKLKNQVFYISKDHPDWMSNGINAGVWIVKNNKLGRKFMDIWLEGYDKNKWKFIDNKWTCGGSDINQKDINSSCPWSGYNFEQGYLNHIIENNDFIHNNIFVFNNNVLNAHYDTKFKNNVIAYHFSGMENINDLRYKFMKIVKINF